MKLLSVDVGIKNLAFCLFVKPDGKDYYEIAKWDVVNLSQQLEYKCCHLEKGAVCDKPAKFSKSGKHYCLKHAKKQEYQIPTCKTKLSSIQKYKIGDLQSYAENNKIAFQKPIKRAELLSLVLEHVQTTSFEPIKETNASKLDLITIGRNIMTKMDDIFTGDSCVNTIDQVIIENQISPIANRMKTIQGMIAQYFIMRHPDIKIDFVNASNKLKDVVKENTVTAAAAPAKEASVKMKYGDRKKASIQKTMDTVSTDFRYQEWETFFKKHGKKDDLSDAFLQGLWYINK
jgi:hypothetical protein